MSSVKDPPEESASNSGISNSSVPSVTVEQCTTEVGDNSGVKHGPGTLMGDVQKMFNPEEGGNCTFWFSPKFVPFSHSRFVAFTETCKVDVA